MNILMNFLAVMFLGYPALIAGYMVAAIKSGYLAGAHIYSKHEDEAMDKFLSK